MASTPPIPQRLLRTVGPLGEPGRLPEPHPFETVTPRREGFVERGGVKSWYAQYGDEGPWLAFAPIFQIAHSHILRGVLPYLSQHSRVVVMDLRGNGRSDRPRRQDQYSFDHYHADFVAVLDRLEVERAAVVGISATAMTAIRLASEQPQRVWHLVLVGGWVERRLDAPAVVDAVKANLARMRADWPAYLDEFFTVCEGLGRMRLGKAYLEREGERLHPFTARLANESRHFESQAGEPDLQAFFALRTMDEVMARNFMVFAELLRHRAHRALSVDPGPRHLGGDGEPALGGGLTRLTPPPSGGRSGGGLSAERPHPNPPPNGEGGKPFYVLRARSTFSAVPGASMCTRPSPRAAAAASRSASNTLIASMNGGSPTALLPPTLSSGLAWCQSSTLKCSGTSPVAGIL